MKIRSEGYAVSAIVYTIVEAIRLFAVVSVHVILQEPLGRITRAQMAGLNACFVISHDAGIIVSKEFVWKRLANEHIAVDCLKPPIRRKTIVRQDPIGERGADREFRRD